MLLWSFHLSLINGYLSVVFFLFGLLCKCNPAGSSNASASSTKVHNLKNNFQRATDVGKVTMKKKKKNVIEIHVRCMVE